MELWGHPCDPDFVPAKQILVIVWVRHSQDTNLRDLAKPESIRVGFLGKVTSEQGVKGQTGPDRQKATGVTNTALAGSI